MFKKNILITGGCGFIGSNFINYFCQKYPNYLCINLDNLTYAADQANLQEVQQKENYIFIKGDIRNKVLLDEIFSKYSITDIIHFAAESHVDNSISSPEAFIETNINGTFALLNKGKQAWSNSSSRFHHISTDEVYGTLGSEGLFTETTPYAPNSPYSASKASSDMLVRSYFHTFGMNVVTTNCSNNYGPRQHLEKLIPTIIRKALKGESIPIYGDGSNVRDWLYVTDHCEAIDLVFHKSNPGETYNIGGECEFSNNLVCQKICNILDSLKPLEDKSYHDLVTFVKDRPGHDKRYAIDISKIKNELGWKPKESFESGIERTINWYISKLNS